MVFYTAAQPKKTVNGYSDWCFGLTKANSSFSIHFLKHNVLQEDSILNEISSLPCSFTY